MKKALVIPVRLFGRWVGFLYSWGCFRLFLLALFFFAPVVVCAQWELDRRLTFNDSVSSSPVCNASGLPGDVHVLWRDLRDGNLEIYYKRSTDQGLTWSLDSRLTQDPSVSYSPNLSASDSLVHVVWREERDGNREIYYKRSTDAGTTWLGDMRLTRDSSFSEYPAVFASGTMIHVIWDDGRDDSNGEIYYKRSTDLGVSWSSDQRLTFFRYWSYYASVASSRNYVHAVWMDERDRQGYPEVYYKRSTDGGLGWEGDVCLSYNPLYSETPCLSVSDSLVHVAWRDDRDGNVEIYYIRSSDNGTGWSPETRLTNASGSSMSPSLSASGLNVHLTWMDTRGGTPDIYYKRSTDGGVSWSSDFRLSDLADTSRAPSVSVSGSFVHVVWYDNRDGNYEIYYKRNPTGNSGVEESIGSFYPLSSNLSFSVVPNPFTSFATLLGHEAERFSLYDISGRKVGVYRGDRIGEGLSAGVYFLRPQEGNAKPVRVVKVR